jgi:hypothetical protein
MCSDLLSHYKADDKSFLVTDGDETRIHQFELWTKRQSMEWHHPTSPRKKFKAQQEKAWPTFFFGCRGGILVKIIPHGQIINSDLYI